MLTATPTSLHANPNFVIRNMFTLLLLWERIEEITTLLQRIDVKNKIVRYKVLARDILVFQAYKLVVVAPSIITTILAP